MEELNFKSFNRYEALKEEEAKKIFRELCELNDNQNTIDLNFIRRLLSINNNKYSDVFLKFITQYKLIDSLKSGNFNKDSLHNIVFNEDEFVNFITGKDTKDLLFDDNLDLGQKRFKIDDYAKLYDLIVGNQGIINKEVLKANILEVLKELNDGESIQEKDDLAEKEADEIIELLGSNENSLTPEDFLPVPDEVFVDFPDNTVLDLGGVTVELLPFPGHTPGMTCPLIPEDRILIIGDACDDNVLLFDQFASTVSEYKRNLQEMIGRKESYDKILGNHGNYEYPMELLENVLESCDLILTHKDAHLAVHMFGEDLYSAHPIKEDGMRIDGKPGNVLYADEKAC